MIAAVQSCGSADLALTQLLAQADTEPAIAQAQNVDGNMEPPAPSQNDGDSLTNLNIENAESSSQANDEQVRDEEMEDMLAQELQNTDALSDYEIEVTQEGEAITEYLSLLSAI